MLKGLLLRSLHFYKTRLSPLLPRACRYSPTCSEYTAISIKKYGPLRGIAKGAWRIARCQPFTQGGIDLP